MYVLTELRKPILTENDNRTPDIIEKFEDLCTVTGTENLLTDEVDLPYIKILKAFIARYQNTSQQNKQVKIRSRRLEMLNCTVCYDDLAEKNTLRGYFKEVVDRCCRFQR